MSKLANRVLEAQSAATVNRDNPQARMKRPMMVSNLSSFADAIANERLPGKIEFDKYPSKDGLAIMGPSGNQSLTVAV